jgi:hypothetical protein
LRKDSALTPVTSEKPTLFLGLQRLLGCAKIEPWRQGYIRAGRVVHLR